ncbi:MAG: hypothetical protein ACAI25_11360 [Planctomycetota bacterium]
MALGLLLACPGCLTAEVVKYGAPSGELSASSNLCAIARIASEGRTLTVAATSFSCRVTIRDELTPSPTITTYERVAPGKAEGIAVTGERLLVAYGITHDGAPSIAVLEGDDAHSFALKQPDGSWQRTTVSTFESRESASAPRILKWLVVASVLPFACVGDALIGVGFVVGWVAILAVALAPGLAGLVS